MSKKQVTYSITEVTMTTGKTASIRVMVDGVQVTIPLDAEIKAYFDAQFFRSNPTTQQKKKYATIMNLLAAAYKAGKAAK
jgi:23S rRNA-/tRNA-specific pseudouridylate synthase